MSSRTKKNVDLDRKPTRSHHRSSRDSGVGSSSASDRASLGTAPDSPFTYQQRDEQRQILGAVQEVLDAANEKIRQLEAANAKLNTALKESNQENRLLKREKAELHNKLDEANEDLDAEAKAIQQLTTSSVA
jgi:septal ring factor EnvC (AmiA/AmiB activator)